MVASPGLNLTNLIIFLQQLLSAHCDSFMKFAAQAGSPCEWFIKTKELTVLIQSIQRL